MWNFYLVEKCYNFGWLFNNLMFGLMYFFYVKMYVYNILCIKILLIKCKCEWYDFIMKLKKIWIERNSGI